jgi:hypothetical protein
MNETILADVRYALSQLRRKTEPISVWNLLDRMRRAVDALERAEGYLKEGRECVDGSR